MVFLLYYWGMQYIHVASAKICEFICIDTLIHPRSTLPLRSSWANKTEPTITTTTLTSSLIPRPRSRFCLAAVEKNQSQLQDRFLSTADIISGPRPVTHFLSREWMQHWLCL